MSSFVHHREMELLMADYQTLTELLGLSHMRVTHYQLVGDYQINLFIESTIDRAVCPHCGGIHTTIHELSAEQTIRDLPMWSRRCWLRYRPRRFLCQPCNKSFVERVDWREGGYNYTYRYQGHVFERTRHQPIAYVAREERLSENIVQGIFTRYAEKK